jgi:glycosyltransferase involved in cell wall biosynthesis
MDVTSYGVTQPSPIEGKLRILWSGSRTHSKDLELIDGVIEPVLKRWGDRVEFVYVGAISGNGAFKYLHNGVHFEKGVDLSMYPRLLGVIKPQIVLAPLVDCDFNRAKSSIRVMEAGCLAAPVIASPVGEYAEYVRHGETGFFAETTEEWVEYLNLLIGDHLRRERMGSAGRELVTEVGDWANPKCREEWKSALSAMANLCA